MRTGIHCNFITPKVRELAEQLGKNVHVINNVISVWQTEMGTSSLPKLEQLNERLSLSRDLNDEFYLAEPYTILSKEKSKDGRLAETTRDAKGRKVVKLYPINNVEEFFNYIYGNNDSPTAKQKQEVMKRLHKLGYTEEALRKSITSLRDVELILEWHEMSHIAHGHSQNYYTAEEKADKSKVDWMAENKIQAEYEATLDALEKFSEYLKYRTTSQTVKPKSVEQFKKEREDREKKAEENINKVVNIFNNWLTSIGKRITFDEKSHTYYIDGKPTDFTASSYAEAVFGAKDFGPAYRPAADIGNSVDAISRDYFLGVNVYNKIYPNINEERKNTIIASLNRLKDRLDREFGKNTYKVITNEIRLAGYIGEGANKKSIGGTPDMILIDGDGNLHLLDFKAKKLEIDAKIGGKPTTDRRDYTMQLNIYKQLLESIDPSFKGKVKDLKLIWFKTDYPSSNRVEYSKDNEGNITAKDPEIGQTFPLAFYPEWTTPSLKTDIDKSLIPLDISKKVFKVEVPQVSPIEQPETQQQPAQEQQAQKTVPQTQQAPSTPTQGPISLINIQQTVRQEQQSSREKKAVKNPALSNADETLVNVDTESPSVRLARAFTPIERALRVDYLARAFSQNLTIALNRYIKQQKERASQTTDEDLLREIRNNIREAQDPENGRKFILEQVTPNAIFKAIKAEWEYALSNPGELLKNQPIYGRKILENAPKVLDNFFQLMREACVLIEDMEDIRIIPEEVTVSNGTTQEKELSALVTDSEESRKIEEEDNADDEDQSKVTGNDGWSFKVRYVDPHSTTSRVIKRLLSNIVQRDQNGTVKDDLGNYRYLNSRVAYTSLLDALSSMDSPNDFAIRKKNAKGEDIKDANGNYKYTFPALEDLQGRYPWVKSIIKELNKNPDLVPAFFTAFRKDFIPYWMQKFDKEENKWTTFFMNQPVAKESTLNEVTTNYEKGFFTAPGHNIYNQAGKILKKRVKEAIKLVEDLQVKFQELQPDEYEDFQEKLSKLVNSLGFNVRPSQIADFFGEFNDNGDLIKETDINAITRILEECSKILRVVDSDTWTASKHLILENKDSYSTLAELLGTVSDYMQTASIRQADKTFYSYSAPNYINTLVKRLKNKDAAKVIDFIEREYGEYSWFKDQANQGLQAWKCPWLVELMRDPEARRQLELKELKFIGNKEYADWDTHDINIGFMFEYYSVPKKGTGKEYAWYNFPILSDSPLAMFIKFRRYTDRVVADANGTRIQGFEKDITRVMREVVLQEISRIKLVQDRKEKIEKGEINKIANFDDNGNKFNFLPELNSYVFEEAEPLSEEEIAQGVQPNIVRTAFLDKIISLNGDITVRNQYIEKAINDVMTRLSDAYITRLTVNQDIYTITSNLIREGIIQDLGNTERNLGQAKRAIKEYYWNQMFASSQIIELTTTDLAYYKDSTDFQKRFKEIYAAGDKLFTASKYGKEIEKTLYLTDYSITSNIYEYLKKSLEKAVEEHRIQKYDMENILNKFKDITSTDAQAYRSLSSLRSVLDMMGKWDDRMEQAFERFDKGDWDMGDFNTVWQTIKPFMFTNTSKDDGVGGKLRVAHQNKNSEFLLLSTMTSLVSAISHSPKLMALNKFMEKNHIDVVQFESAVKAGKQGHININYSQAKLNKWLVKESNKKAVQALQIVANNKGLNLYTYDGFKEANDSLLSSGKISQDTYNERMQGLEPDEEEVTNILNKHALLEDGVTTNPNVVHELNYEDYCIQQPTPEHIFDTTSVFGSQFRNLIIADLPADFSVTVHGVKLNREQLINLYQSSIINNLLDDYEKLRKELGTIESLQQMLLRQVKTNPKYMRDMINALELKTVKNPFTGKEEKVFNIPLNNPTIALQMQELLLSLFKNRITKQHIRGAACTLVSDFGLTNELKILYNKPGDKNSGIKGIECYMPAYSKKFYETLMKTDSKGNKYLDINELPTELRKAVGFRIPTEDKYSMVPLIIKGFLPQQNGSSIMLPAEIVTMAGSDFDIDKLYIMLPEFKIIEYNREKAKMDFARIFNVSLNDEEGKKSIENNKEFKEFFERNKKSYRYDKPQLVKIKYNLKEILNNEEERDNLSRAQRDNLLIDLSRAVLCSPEMHENLMNPGSFDNLKVVERANRILSDPSALFAFIDYLGVAPEEANSDKTRRLVLDALDKLTKEENLKELNKILGNLGGRNSLTIDTFAYNHKQNMTGAALIGMYANNSSMHAKYQHTSLGIREEFRFTVDGKILNSLHDVYAKDKNGNITHRISKLAASFINASVDNVKDPVLAGLMQNSKTANVAAYLVRAGVEARTIGILFNQPIIKELIDSTGDLSDANLKLIIEQYLKLSGTSLGKRDLERLVKSTDFNYRTLMNNCLDGMVRLQLSEEKQKEFYLKQAIIGKLFRDIINPVANDLAELTRISRADSPNGAVAHTLGGAKMQSQRVTRFLRKAKMHNKTFTLYGLNERVLDADVNKDMPKDALRKKFVQSRVPVLQAFYSLGIDFANSTLEEYFPQVNEKTDDLISRIIDNAPNTALMKEGGTKIINNFYKDLTTFVLTKTKTFGSFEDSDFMSKRAFYLYEYPKLFLEAIESNDEVKSLPIIRKLTVEKGEIILLKSGRLSAVGKELLMNSLDQLLYMDGNIKMTFNGEEKTFPVQKLAEDLFMYTFFNNNLNFGPNSYSQFISTQLTSSFEEVVSALRWLDHYMTDQDYENFMDQLYANRGNDMLPQLKGWSSGPFPSPNYIRISEKEIAFKPDFVANRNGLIIDSNGIKSHGAYERIILDNEDPLGRGGGVEMYEVVKSTQGNLSGNVHYIKVPTFPTRKVVYNAEMNVEELKDALDEELEDYKDSDVKASKYTSYDSPFGDFFDESQLVSSSGDVKADSGTTKVDDTSPIPDADIKPADPRNMSGAELAIIEAYLDEEEREKEREASLKRMNSAVQSMGGFDSLDEGLAKLESQEYSINDGQAALDKDMCIQLEGMDI